jgi:hypothetical protein
VVNVLFYVVACLVVFAGHSIACHLWLVSEVRVLLSC